MTTAHRFLVLGIAKAKDFETTKACLQVKQALKAREVTLILCAQCLTIYVPDLRHHQVKQRPPGP